MAIFIAWIVFILLQQETNLNCMKDHEDFCNVNMPYDETKILKFNQYQKSDKAPFIIYADLEYIIILKVHLQQK